MRPTVALFDVILPQISVGEWNILKNLKNILEPFGGATRTIIYERFPGHRNSGL